MKRVAVFYIFANLLMSGLNRGQLDSVSASAFSQLWYLLAWSFLKTPLYPCERMRVTEQATSLFIMKIVLTLWMPWKGLCTLRKISLYYFTMCFIQPYVFRPIHVDKHRSYVLFILALLHLSFICLLHILLLIFY